LTKSNSGETHAEPYDRVIGLWRDGDFICASIRKSCGIVDRRPATAAGNILL
jgi:hypothetical protein